MSQAQSQSQYEEKDGIIRKWPTGASDEYIQARQSLRQAEWTLRESIERVAAMRRALPPGAVMDDYTFAEGPRDLGTDSPVRSVTLEELTREKGVLVLYHMMFAEDEAAPCPACSMFIDGFVGVAPHLAQHVTAAVVCKAPLPKLRDWMRRRNWNGSPLRFLSSSGSSFNKDMSMEFPDWAPGLNQAPGISVFRMDTDDKGGAEVVRHTYTNIPQFDSKTERGMDLLSPLWNLLDITPQGRPDWNPTNSYINHTSMTI